MRCYYCGSCFLDCDNNRCFCSRSMWCLYKRRRCEVDIFAWELAHEEKIHLESCKDWKSDTYWSEGYSCFCKRRTRIARITRMYNIQHREHREFDSRQQKKKTGKNPFWCLWLFQRPYAKCYAFVFKNEFLSLRHTTKHITIVIANIKKKKHRLLSQSKKQRLALALN